MTAQDRKRAADALAANWDDVESVRSAVLHLKCTDPALKPLHDRYQARLLELEGEARDKYVLGFAFCRRPELDPLVVLIRKKRPDWQMNCLNGVGGKINAGEHVADAMTREFQQETGVHVAPCRWNYFAMLEWAKARVVCYTVDLRPEEKAVTTTDEEVVVDAVGDVLVSRSGLVMCCRWLIPLALDRVVQPVTAQLR